MMKTKKLMSFMLSFVMLLSVLGITGTSFAATQSVSANKSYTFELSKSTKTFTFKMPKSGYYYCKITPLYCLDESGNEEGGWWVIDNASMIVNHKEYENLMLTSDGPVYSAKYAFKKGTKIQFKFKDNSYRTLGIRFKIITKNPKNFEKESNNAKKNANKLTVNKTYGGYLMEKDKDYFVFTAPKAGRYKVSAVCAEEESGAFDAYVYKGSKQAGTKYLMAGDGYGSVFKGKLKKGQKIYIKCEADYYYNVKYKVRVKKVG